MSKFTTHINQYGKVIKVQITLSKSSHITLMQGAAVKNNNAHISEMITVGPGILVLHKDHAVLVPSNQAKPNPQQELVYKGYAKVI